MFWLTSACDKSLFNERILSLFIILISFSLTAYPGHFRDKEIKDSLALPYDRGIDSTVYDENLRRELLQILDDDQRIRRKLAQAMEEPNPDVSLLDSLRRAGAILDSINTIKVTKILDERGWVGMQVVGGSANATLFLVIQHSHPFIQQKYLPMMREAVKNGNALKSELAMLEDRVLIGQGRRQLYGTQVIQDPASGKPKFYPIADEINVNIRRNSVGLGRIENYAEHFGFTYVPPKNLEGVGDAGFWNKKPVWIAIGTIGFLGVIIIFFCYRKKRRIR